MKDERLDVWVLGFAPGVDAEHALVRVFGIDAERAKHLLATVPRAVKRGATQAEAQAIAEALNELGATVEVRPAEANPRASGTQLPRVGAPTPATSPDASAAPSANLDAGVEKPAGDGDDGARVAEPRLDLDAPLIIAPATPRGAKASAPGMPKAPARPPEGPDAAPAPAAPAPAAPAQPAAPPAAPKAAAPKTTPAASMDPLDPMTAGGEALQLAFEPEKEREKPSKPVARQGVDAEAIRRIEEQRAIEENPELAKKKPRFTLPKISPRVLRTGIALLLGILATLGLRYAVRSCATSPGPPPPGATMTQEERTLATAVDVQAFLARPDARLGIDQGRNRQLADALREEGAAHVLAAEIVEAGGRETALVLVVELPASPLRRRRIQAAIVSYEDRHVVDPQTVTPPPASQRHVFIDLE